MTGNRRQMYSILETDTQRVQETMDQEIQVEIKPAVKGIYLIILCRMWSNMKHKLFNLDKNV